MASVAPWSDTTQIAACLARHIGQPPAAQLHALVNAGCDQLPLPGQGATLARWQALAAVAEHDLSLAKLYEGHTDALAILKELGLDEVVSPGSRWGTWAAEAPGRRVVLSPDGRLDGAKAWCSGAAHLTHAVLTAWSEGSDQPQLVAVDLSHAGVQVKPDAWHAVGMAGTATATVHFERVPAICVGSPGCYLSRSGFWHGGAGIAACWYGGAVALGRALHATTRASPQESLATPFRWAALGAVDVALGGCRALLHEAAAWIDAQPQSDASAIALRVRQSAEQAVRRVLDLAGRAMGPAPFCLDASFARMAADLPVFIRQSHAERDDASLGQRVQKMALPWAL